VLLFTLGISVLTSFVFGLIPSLQAGKTDVQETLKEGGNTMSAGAVGGWLRPMLVVVEVAAAVVLLIGAGLMIRSILRIREVEPGLRWQNLLVCENFSVARKIHRRRVCNASRSDRRAASPVEAITPALPAELSTVLHRATQDGKPCRRKPTWS
jgi:hypothetical protein